MDLLATTDNSRIRAFQGRSLTVYWYIVGEFFVSFLVSFAFFFFMFFINQLLLLAEDILQKDVSLWNVILLIVYSLPAIIALSVPFGTLVGTLMAVGRLSADNEIVALRASGAPLLRIFSPVWVLAIVMAIVSFFTNDFLLPLGTLNFGRLYRELLYANPALELEPYSVKRYQNDILVTGPVEEGIIKRFAIIDTDEQGNRRVITAREAALLQEGNVNAIGLELSGVATHSALSPSQYDYSTAATLRYNILLQDITVAIRSPGPREMSARDVLTAIREKEDAIRPGVELWSTDRINTSVSAGIAAAVSRSIGIDDKNYTAQLAQVMAREPNDRSLQVYRIEYHKKFSIPFAAVSFVILAFPLGLFSKRSGRGVGFGIGLLIATGYWAMLIAGQTFGTQRPDVSPALAMWAPNVFFLIAGVFAFVRKSRQ